MQGLRAGRARVGGRHGYFMTMASDMLRFTGRFYEERGRELVGRPTSGQAWATAAASVLCVPLVPVTLLCAAAHFIAESRFNRSLLFDLVARPTASAAPAIAQGL